MTPLALLLVPTGVSVAEHEFSGAIKGREAFGCVFPSLSQQCAKCAVVRLKSRGVWHYHNRYEGLGTGLENKCGQWPCVPFKLEQE